MIPTYDTYPNANRTPKTLNGAVTDTTMDTIMCADFIVVSDGNGNLRTDLESVNAPLSTPTLTDGELESQNGRWEIIDGLRDDNEYVGGKIADYVLENAGTYVVIDSYWEIDNPSSDIGNVISDPTLIIEGWALVKFLG